LEHELRGGKYVSLAGKAGAKNTHVRNDTVEPAPCVSETMLACRELTEVTSCPGDCVVEELEHNASRRFGVDCNVKLKLFSKEYVKKSEIMARNNVEIAHENVRPRIRGGRR
jgi:hypothetical protein